MSVSEKVAYLRGLMEGLDIDEEKKEGKLFAAIIDALDEIASEISDIDEDLIDLQDYVEEIDEDLGDVEEFVYDCCDDDCDCCEEDCDCCDEECIEVTCPACEEEVCIGFDEIDDNGEVECPCCGAVLEFEIEEEEEAEIEK